MWRHRCSTVNRFYKKRNIKETVERGMPNDSTINENNMRDKKI